jgi:calreticulin
MNSFAIVRILLIISIFEISLSTIYFQEEFDFGWRQRWVLSDWKKDQQGDVALGASDWYADHDRDVGLQTLTNLKFISLSAKFPSFTNLQKDLVLQFSVQYPQKIDCGGGYIKLLNSDFDQTQFGGETPLLIMFGPDICGPETRIQLILDYKAEGYAWNKHFAAEDDQLTHVYTMVLHPDNTYKVLF